MVKILAVLPHNFIGETQLYISHNGGRTPIFSVSGKIGIILATREYFDIPIAMRDPESPETITATFQADEILVDLPVVTEIPRK